jgi:acyl carrier protein
VKSNINETIVRIFQDHFKFQGDASGNISRKDVPEWSSLNHIMFFIKLEKEFGIKFTAHELIEVSDLSMVIKLVNSKLHER